MPDLLPLAAPSYEELASRQLRRLGDDDDLEVPFGKYELRARLPAGPGDECFAAVPRGPAGFTKYAFLRRFPWTRIDDALVAAVERRAPVQHVGIEQLFDLAVHERHGYLVSELVSGLGLDHLDDALRRRGERLPWRTALAMLHDACHRLLPLRAAGVGSDVTPAHLRLSITGRLYLCFGLPPAAEPAWGRTLCGVVRPILALAATAEERALLDGLLRDTDDAGAVAVASDALVQRHPELDPGLPALLLAMLEDEPDVGGVTDLLLEDRPQLAIHRLWSLVAEVLSTPRPGYAA